MGPPRRRPDVGPSARKPRWEARGLRGASTLGDSSSCCLSPPLHEQESAQGFTPGSVFSSRPRDGSHRLGF